MISEKTNLPSLRNIEWRTLKTKTNKINQVLPYISTNNITELNELIYVGAKLFCEKIGIPSKSTKKKSKPGSEIRLETQIKNLRKLAKMIKQKNDAGICRSKAEKGTQEKIKQYRRNRRFQNNERKFYQQLGDDTKTYQQPDAKETERF